MEIRLFALSISVGSTGLAPVDYLHLLRRFTKGPRIARNLPVNERPEVSSVSTDTYPGGKHIRPDPTEYLVPSHTHCVLTLSTAPRRSMARLKVRKGCQGSSMVNGDWTGVLKQAAAVNRGSGLCGGDGNKGGPPPADGPRRR